MFEELKEKRGEYLAYINKVCTIENIKNELKVLFEESKLDILIFRGYTPSFNDGDPCTHSSYIIDSNYELREELESYDEEFLNQLSFDFYDESYEINKDFNHDNLDIFEYALETALETDYEVIVYREDDSKDIKVQIDSYCCGY